MKTEINKTLGSVEKYIKAVNKASKFYTKVTDVALTVLQDEVTREALVNGIERVIVTTLEESGKVAALVKVRHEVDLYDVQESFEEMEEEFKKAS